MADWLWAVIRWFHLIALAFWLGGQLFLFLVVRPVLRAAIPDRVTRVELTAALGHRYSPLAWLSLGVMVVTGWLLGVHRGVDWFALLAWRDGYGRVLATKMVLVGLVLALTLAHGRLIGPRLARSTRTATTAGGERASSLGRWSIAVSVANLVLTLAVVLLAARLVP
ncbi:MAG: DUF4149 domain-containing protein [Thermomicrobium sp.]|nr:DUF4149 domain-containing protein [Thermomicrobium sp.]